MTTPVRILTQCILPVSGCLLGFAGQVRAQTTVAFGPRVGLSVATASYRDDNNRPYAPKTRAVAGVETGVMATFSRGHLAVQPALLYAQKGFVLHGDYRQTVNGQTAVARFHTTHTLNYLTVPLNVAYVLRADGEGLQVFGGGYASALIGGRVAYDDYNGIVGSTDAYYQAKVPVRAGREYVDADHFYSRRFDAGLQAGAGYRYRAWLVQAAWSVGLPNLGVDYPMNPSPAGPRYRNRALSVSLNYLIQTTGGRQKRPTGD